ncbi:2-aminoethanethiol dioxygenase-like [Watersipora subatra]|uniref:2-aminoethanethiol dioxygenase-like n=1 Tax=Watersipora subatra TaxID=2589382 RepID=UPI00355BE535
MANSSKISKVLRFVQQLVKTDNPLISRPEFEQHISQITHLISSVQKEDVNFHASSISKRAPVTFINIYDDELTLSASIFALQDGSFLPTHDHPHMYGFIKCIYGTLKITSYSPVNQSSVSSQSIPTSASKEPDVYLTDTSQDVAVLMPDKGNVHSIAAIDGPGAFIDFLIPPYAFRDNCCHYFSVDGNDSSKGLYTLHEVDCPSSYWCATVPYTGPQL